MYCDFFFFFEAFQNKFFFFSEDFFSVYLKLFDIEKENFRSTIVFYSLIKYIYIFKCQC
jgi:hypothetical protein